MVKSRAIDRYPRGVDKDSIPFNLKLSSSMRMMKQVKLITLRFHNTVTISSLDSSMIINPP